MTTVHINQPRFLPALNYFQRMLIADIWIWRDDVQFQRKDWENRNKIKTAQGWQWVTVPVKACPPGTNIMKAEIDDSISWRPKMLSAIRCSYGKAPYFDEWFPHAAAIILDRSYYRLLPMNFAFVGLFQDAWGLDDCHFRTALDLACQGTKDSILIEMCKKVGADVYLSGAEGRNYNCPENWKAAGIDPRYHDYDHPVYPQQFGQFLPWMSALDLLMNRGAAGRKVLEIGIEKWKT